MDEILNSDSVALQVPEALGLPMAEVLVVTTAVVLRTEPEDTDYTDFVGEEGHLHDLGQDVWEEDNYLVALVAGMEEGMESSFLHDVAVLRHIPVALVGVDAANVDLVVGNNAEDLEEDGREVSFLHLDAPFSHPEDIRDGEEEP